MRIFSLGPLFAVGQLAQHLVRANGICPFFGHWVLQHDSWSAFPASERLELYLDGRETTYYVMARALNRYSATLTQLGDGSCSAMIGERIVQKETFDPELTANEIIAEDLTAELLRNTLMVSSTPNGNLAIVFGGPKGPQRVEFTRFGNASAPTART
eukprot:Gregarina_sp_Poly_1__662@NODE_1159_length_4905_cov_618_352625_g795_i0_p5_GENE_NODE_1159_length_4905_cov_618_352625_g795_i0NODE_1159_length_4905_cov_618_352625_g795_i0_p5_ORF_typecomplete_len157_score17_05_NODE_1159_length_4905_cov_618_352625_g795_i027533223